MSKLEDIFLNNDTHRGANCFVMAVICHGNNKGQLKDSNKRKAWDIEEMFRRSQQSRNVGGQTQNPDFVMLQRRYYNFLPLINYLHWQTSSNFVNVAILVSVMALSTCSCSNLFILQLKLLFRSGECWTSSRCWNVGRRRGRDKTGNCCRQGGFLHRLRYSSWIHVKKALSY